MYIYRNSGMIEGGSGYRALTPFSIFNSMLKKKVQNHNRALSVKGWSNFMQCIYNLVMIMQYSTHNTIPLI